MEKTKDYILIDAKEFCEFLMLDGQSELEEKFDGKSEIDIADEPMPGWIKSFSLQCAEEILEQLLKKRLIESAGLKDDNTEIFKMPIGVLNLFQERRELLNKLQLLERKLFIHVESYKNEKYERLRELAFTGYYVNRVRRGKLFRRLRWPHVLINYHKKPKSPKLPPKIIL